MTPATCIVDDIVQEAADAAMEVYRDGNANPGERAQALFIEMLVANGLEYLTKVERRMRYLNFTRGLAASDSRMFEAAMRNFRLH